MNIDIQFFLYEDKGIIEAFLVIKFLINYTMPFVYIFMSLLLNQCLVMIVAMSTIYIVEFFLLPHYSVRIPEALVT